LGSGGIAHNTIRLTRELIQRGYDVDLVLTTKGGKYVSRLPDGLNVINLDSIRQATGILGLIRYLRHVKPKALISARDSSNIICILAKRLANSETRLIISVRTHMSIHYSKVKSLKKKLIPYLAKITYPFTDELVTVSEGVAKNLSEVVNYPQKDINVIYNPIVDENLVKKSEETVQEKWFDLDTPLIINVGRLREQKDYPTMFKAFKNLLYDMDARLVILGDGKQKDRLKQMSKKLGINQKVKFLGFVDNPYKYLSKADLFVLSSRWEGFGNVVVEALAVGTPVVSTDCPSGPAEILDYGNYGKLVPVGDYEALSNSIKKSLTKSHDESRLKKRAQEFSVEKCADKYLSLIYQKTKMR